MIKGNPTEVRMFDGRIHGLWRGVVEDADDPLSQGRAKCRIWGLHSTNTSKTDTGGIPLDDLPWVEPCIPIMEGGKSGFGIFSPPVVGAHLLIYFENGHPQAPKYIAAIPSGEDWNPKADKDGFIIEVHGGHYLYFNSKSGEETVKLFHTKGAYIEFDKDGGLTIEVKKDMTVNVAGNAAVTVNGNVDVTASGQVTIAGSSISLN